MAAAAAVQNEQPQQCSICIDVFTDPRTLPCLHTYCLKCISAWCKDKKPGNIVACPQCREEFAIPDSGIVGMNMLRVNEVEQNTKELCEICVGEDRKAAELLCLQCEQSYCKSCSNAHKRMKISSSHVLAPLDNVPKVVGARKKSRPINCEKHADQKIELYCIEDEVDVCSTCCALDHRSHHCENMKKVVDTFQFRRQEKLQNAMSKVNQSMEALNSRKQSFLDQVKSVETEIREEADKRIQVIESHRQKLLSELQELQAGYEEELDCITREFTKRKSLLTRFTDYCDKLWSEGTDVEMCREEHNLRRRTEELINVETLKGALGMLGAKTISFSPCDETFEDTKNIIGQVKADDLQLLATLSNPPKRGDGRSREVTGVEVLEKFLYVIYRDYFKVEVFDCESHFKKVKDIKVVGMDNPVDIVGCNETMQVFIFTLWNKVILRIDLKTELSDVFITSVSEGQPFGLLFVKLSLMGNHLLFKSSDSLLMFDIHSGKKTKTIPLNGEVNKSRLLHAIESGRNSFFVSGVNTVKEIDSEGRVIRVFNSIAKLPCEYLALDSVGRLLVAGSDWENGRVVLLDQHLQFERVLLDKKRLENEKPWTLKYDKRKNRLVVGLWNGHVKIFQCKPNV